MFMEHFLAQAVYNPQRRRFARWQQCELFRAATRSKQRHAGMEDTPGDQIWAGKNVPGIFEKSFSF